MPLYQMPRPMPPILGGGAPVAAQTYLFPVAQPDRSAAHGLARARASQVEAAKQLDGPPVHQSFLFAVSQPQMRPRIQIPRVRPSLDVLVPIAEVFKVSQPEAWLYRRDPRTVTDGGCRPPIVQASVAVTQTDVYQLSEPDQRRWTLRALRDINAMQDGLGSPKQLTGPDTDRASYIFPVNQPEPIRWALREVARTQGGQPAQVIGAAVDQTYEFVPNQPNQAAWLLPQGARRQGGPTSPNFGPASQPTFVFVPNQPDAIRFSQLQRTRGLGGSVAYPLDTFVTIITTTVSRARVTSTSEGSWRTTSEGDRRTTE
jgi:hypothetical protein